VDVPAIELQPNLADCIVKLCSVVSTHTDCEQQRKEVAWLAGPTTAQQKRLKTCDSLQSVGNKRTCNVIGCRGWREAEFCVTPTFWVLAGAGAPSRPNDWARQHSSAKELEFDCSVFSKLFVRLLLA
jgi:hypothetical protein